MFLQPYMSSVSHHKTSGLISGFLIGILILMHYLGWLQTPEKAVRTITVPMLHRLYTVIVTLRNHLSFWQGRNELTQVYISCQKDLQQALLRSAQSKMLSDENDDLRAKLELKLRAQIPVIVAEVIGKDLTNTQQIIFINKGGIAGIKIGDPVVVDKGILVGRIIKVAPDVAWVLLIKDSQSKVAATILNHDHSLGVVEGGNGISLRMKFIPRNEVVAVGDQIVTSGLEDNTPRGLLIGSVQIVENEAYQPFQQALLTPPYDLNKLTSVGILQTN